MPADIWITCPGCGVRVPGAQDLCANGCCYACHDQQTCDGVPCAECSQPTPTVLLCEHDHPVCLGCCEATHPRPCSRCHGHGHITPMRPDGRGRMTDGHGYGVVVPCPDCGSTGRVNETRTA